MYLRSCVGQNAHLFFLIQLILYLCGHKHEQLLNISVVLSTSLEKAYPQLVGQLLPFLKANLAVSRVALVSHQHLHDAVIGVLLYLFDPVLYVLERLSLIYCIGEYYSHRSSIVGLSYSLESLLPGCVPDLQPDFLFANSYRLYFKINADGSQMRGHEIVLAEPEEHVRFADPAVPDH